MKGNVTTSEKFKARVLHLFSTGISSKQVAELTKEEYHRETGKTMTKNVAIGIRFRAGKCDPDWRTREKLSAERKTLSFNKMLSKHKSNSSKSVYWKRKCLSCQEERVLYRNKFICDDCKSTERYGGMNYA